MDYAIVARFGQLKAARPEIEMDVGIFLEVKPDSDLLDESWRFKLVRAFGEKIKNIDLTFRDWNKELEVALKDLVVSCVNLKSIQFEMDF